MISIIFLALLCGAFPALAQEDGNMMSTTSALQDVLSNLKESVEKLNIDNARLADRDNAIKEHIGQLQKELADLESQSDLLIKSTIKLQDENPRLTKEINRLNLENFNLDNQTEKIQSGIKSLQGALNDGYQEDQELLLQLNRAQTAPLPVVPRPHESADDASREHRLKEKLRLMKMIYESQQRQGVLHKSILELQKSIPILPAASALAHQELLKEQIKDLQNQIASLPQESLATSFGMDSQWDMKQTQQLDKELKILEENYSQLKELMGKINLKAQNIQMTVTQHIEEEKLQKSLSALKGQGVGLKAQLDELRSQMVDLDKRKSRIEEMLHKNGN